MIELSFILPMYNVATYLNKCVNSILKTSLDPKSFEILFIDDESPDNSKEIANEIIRENPMFNFKLISQKNKGLGGARNTGIDNATGNYLIFLDPDDLIVDQDLRRTLDEAQSNNLEILEFNALLISPDGKELGRIIVKNHDKIISGVQYSNQYYCSGSACNKLYSRQFLNKYDLRFMEKVYGEDFEFNTRVFYHALRSKGYNKVVSAFLQSPNSITRNNDLDKKIKYLEDYVKILTNLKSYFSSVPALTLQSKVYYHSRMALINTNSFIIILKNRLSLDYALKYRQKIAKDNLLFIKSKTIIKKKELVRVILFSNEKMFKLTFKMNNIFRGIQRLN